VFASPEFMQKVEQLVVKPTIAALNREAIDYKGFIFVGLMNVGGHPYVIEYNARMGDPETQAVMPRIKNDLVELLAATAAGELRDKKIEIDNGHAVTIALVSGGYPGEYEKGKTIRGLKKDSGALVFHAGTRQLTNEVVTDGGRVLAVTGQGNSLEEARENAYMRASEIGWDGLYFRKDIGVDLMNYKGI
jgi:phosphoribosylamine--glycine ligase